MTNKNVTWGAIRLDILRLIREYKQYHRELGCFADWKKCIVADIEFIVRKKRKMKGKSPSKA